MANVKASKVNVWPGVIVLEAQFICWLPPEDARVAGTVLYLVVYEIHLPLHASRFTPPFHPHGDITPQRMVSLPLQILAGRVCRLALVRVPSGDCSSSASRTEYL